MPQLGATEATVTVPVVVFPPTTVGGFIVSEVTGTGFIVNVADFEVPFNEAVIVTRVGTETG